MVDQTLVTETTTRASKITFEEFLRLYDGRHAEWIDGEVLELISATARHQKILVYLVLLLEHFLDRRPLGEVFAAPFAAKLPNHARGREPDILFITQDQLASVKTAHFDGAPALVVEIISAESDRRDRIDKYLEYEAAGVQEYWLIDPRFNEAFFYRLNERGEYARAELTEAGEFASVVLPGFVFPVDTLWMTPNPRPRQISMMVDGMIDSIENVNKVEPPIDG